MPTGPRPYILYEANYRQLLDDRPNVAVLPWGATEAHNYHMPHGTDVIEATAFAERAAELAVERGAKPIVLPTIPYGNDEQQLDQVATVSFTTTTALAILDDVVRSLVKQGIDRIVLVNGHGGNQFKPMVRDMQGRHAAMIVVCNFFEMRRDVFDATFEQPGDHADEMETSLLMHLCPQLLQMDNAGTGPRNPTQVEGLSQPGVWTPRPWSQTHADTGAGDPSKATADKGARYFEAVSAALADVIVGVSKANKGDLPYV